MLLEAYCKMILHAHRYPAHQVHGVLLGKKKKESSEIQITDSIPLFHGPLLAPILEVALIQIEEHCKDKDLVLAGNYYASELITEEKQLPNAVTKVADKIQEQFSSSCVLLIDNSKLSRTPKEVAVQAFISDGKQWKLNSESVDLKDSNTLNILKDFLQEKLLNLQDFDSHLDDVSKDWLNAKLFA